MGPVRLRLLFEDRHMLSKSLRKEGLKRTWVHVKPHHKTITDFAFYLTRTFELDESCPHGIILSMDGFVLPPFESTCIFKDNDLICVKRKQRTFGDVIMVKGDEEEEIVKFLENEEFEKETREYKSEYEKDEEDCSKGTLDVENGLNENTVSKKRKATTKLRSSKKKKKKCIADMSLGVPENDVHDEKTERCVDNGAALSKRGSLKKSKAHDVKVKPKRMNIQETGNESDDVGSDLLNTKRLQRLNKDGNGVNVNILDETKKLPSRSARRKKAKRRWLRELIKGEKKEQLSEKDVYQSPEKDDKILHQIDGTESTKEKNHISTNQQCQSSDLEEEVVPVIVRPGHIRFEPLGEEAVTQQQIPLENFQWNGITSKKKGQKWGKEKSMYSASWDNNINDEDHTREANKMLSTEAKGKKCGTEKDTYNYELNQEVSEMLTTEKKAPDSAIKGSEIDFDKLILYAGLPKKGDVIAYRLIELSSSWCPEVSSFRVGRISMYNSQTNKVILEPVPEYPIVYEKLDNDDEEEASPPQPDTSLYNEDGSLEIEFSSLIDVRIIKHDNSDTVKTVVSAVISSHVVTDKDTGRNNDLLPENGDVTMWDEISEVLSAKKAELSQEEGSRKYSWTHKALRSSALGRTLAILRAENELSGDHHNA